MNLLQGLSCLFYQILNLVIIHFVNAVTHNPPEGLKGAEATAVAVYMARTGNSMMEIRDYINANYYPMDFTLADIRDEYTFDVSCQGSVPQAIECFLESCNFEDAVRNAISLGGDGDTQAAIKHFKEAQCFQQSEELAMKIRLLEELNSNNTVYYQNKRIHFVED